MSLSGKSSASPNALRYQNDMSEEQAKVFQEFKQWIQENNITHNPWHTDSFLLRFCRARKFDLKKIIVMFTDYMKYRTDNNLDTIIGVSTLSWLTIKQTFHWEKKNEVMQYYPKGYCGIDKIGRPIYIEKSGSIKATKFWEVVDNPDDLWRYYYQAYEQVIKLHFMACSVVAKKQIGHCFSILDMTGFSMGMMNKRVYGLVQQASKVT